MLPACYGCPSGDFPHILLLVELLQGERQNDVKSKDWGGDAADTLACPTSFYIYWRGCEQKEYISRLLTRHCSPRSNPCLFMNQQSAVDLPFIHLLYARCSCWLEGFLS